MALSCADVKSFSFRKHPGAGFDGADDAATDGFGADRDDGIAEGSQAVCPMSKPIIHST